MDHGAGVDVVLGTDFVIPAGVRLDLFHATARLPDEVSIPLIKTLNMLNDQGEGPHVNGGPSEDLTIESREFAEYRVPRRQPPLDTHEVWKLAYDGSRDETVFKRECDAYADWLASQPSAVERPEYAVPAGVLPRPPEASQTHGRQLSCAEQWEREIAKREEQEQLATDGSPVGDDPVALPPVHVEADDTSTEGSIESESEGASDASTDDDASDLGVIASQVPAEPSDVTEDRSDWGDSEQSPGSEDSVQDEDSVAVLTRNYLSAAAVVDVEDGEADVEAGNARAKHLPNEINLEDYAHELAFLPDLTEASVTELDYSAENVRHPELSRGRQDRLVKVLKKHEKIMISSGNALPPPAYGVVCDIDVQGHAPIKQRARRIPLRHLKKLYELLRGLLKAGLIAFSNSPWSSPIVIVLRKNGVDTLITRW
ncbi:hypothetical protein PHYSODRAFT_247090 [Phytophthora sojae]|uniref:Reverse transcriptase domain-containing protein n=1 Tax=Phytophthora sojae (strain P6497) TaxID=1094619 RepID=G4YM24_PHYSP|nr:hypothetical protein PHYSODRAFT_247090 [Phytophthora sojae]EGZ27554.1 hypothetical protein PHYSODRAFT_247090 [Phytophthora sojae]|eukprot:XP_009514829.1 hypothetical protein PHYSODRAFT_247090 [Phytophthora sojae]